MTLYEFIAADEMEQAEAIWDGFLIADRKDEEHTSYYIQFSTSFS